MMLSKGTADRGDALGAEGPRVVAVRAAACGVQSIDRERLQRLRIDINFVNSLLSASSLAAPFPFAMEVDQIATTADLYAMEAAVATLLALANSKQKESAFRGDAEERQRRLNEELDARQALINKFYAKLEASEKELRIVKEGHAAALARASNLEAVARAAVEDANRVKAAFALKEKHFANELRKRERDFDRLKEQLQVCLKEPTASLPAECRSENAVNQSGMRESILRSVSSPSMASSDGDLGGGALDVAAARRPAATSSSSSPPLQEGDDAELDRCDYLEHENANLRQLLSSICTILVEIRATIERSSPPGDSPQALSDQIGSLPITWIYDRVKDDIESSLGLIADHINSSVL